jgi:KipI family sensor histidine kinase inhibitor
VRILPMGERALLAEVEGLAEVLSLRAALADAPVEGVEDLVPAARTILVPFDPARVPATTVRSWIERAWSERTDAPTAGPAVAPTILDIAYDGPDLAETAELLGLGPGELAERHERAEWIVAFTGFAPGFGYLTSTDWTFDVSRLDTPRTRVPVGAVGLAGGFSGAYPRETPGGWRLIGTTSAVLFDPAAARPALLSPGDRVRFRRVARGATAPSDRATGRASDSSDVVDTSADASAIRVLEAGLFATVQDLGRPGHASTGVARAGALDRGSLRIANRLVGNPEAAAGVEVTMGGFRAVAERDLWVAVTGGFGPIEMNGHTVDSYAAHEWPRGSELRIGWLEHGARAYLAVRGGIGPVDGTPGTPVLGSLSTDSLAGLGPDPLRDGARLVVGRSPRSPVPPLDLAPWGAPPDDLELEVAPGPRADWFDASALRLLFDAVWTVSGAADRVGVRLDGPELVRTTPGELPSEGMIPGALQVPPGGRPTVLLADGPVTGGYPVIAVVTDASLDALGQARPGTRIRFRHARAAR